jgi:selenocysteine-specific elongation factor
VIVATAGHVDHGKTSLIKQLTGVDTDRLEEEKRRGLSISLGYAYLQQEKGIPIGFIDVPGHQRFINTMISGISGIDMGLLVVAADDGPMPQTREHLDVLQVLGVRKLVVVISKIDRATDERQAQVSRDIRTLVGGIYWDSPEIFSVSNTSGKGMDALRDYLLTCGNKQYSYSGNGCFRLSIDRAFTVKGAGVVVTGTVSTGQVHTGDTLHVHPGEMPIRVRGLRVHDQEAQTATAGQRCAINLAGSVSLADIGRGDWLLAPEVGPASQRLDVECSLLDSASFALKQLSPVKIYIGATRVAGRMALLQTDSSERRLHPGEQCLAQLILEAEVPCYTGQRFLLRDHAEEVLLGGGTILDPEGIASRKSRPARISSLNAMREDSPEQSLAKLLELDTPVDLTRFRRAWNLKPEEKVQVPSSIALEFEAEEKHWLVNQSYWQEADTAMSEFLQDWHKEHPEEMGIKANALRSTLLTRYGSPLLVAVLTAKLSSGSFKLSERRISQANYRPVVLEVSTTQWKLLQSYLTRCGVLIPLQSELSAETGISLKDLEEIARVAIRDGRLFRVSDRRYALPAQLLELCGPVLELWHAEEALNVIALKRCWGAGRNLTIEILEFFDSIRFTQRRGDIRIVLDTELPARLFIA